MSGPGGDALRCAQAVERYLADVAARLPGPPRAHSAILAELRCGLLDATDSHQSAGLPHAEAVQAALRGFGDPGLVADGFLPEIAASQARRVATVLLVTGPLVGLLWLWTSLPERVGAGIGVVAAAVVVTALAAAAGIALTGRLSRWLPAGPRRAPLAAAVAGFGAIGADGLGLVLLAALLAAAPGRLSPLPAAAAAAASIARLLVARRAASRCLQMRARLAG